MEQTLPRVGTRADRTVRIGAAVICVLAMFALQTRYVLVHFAHGAALLDTGWFAWIIAAGDPWLSNPRAVSDLSYFNYHLAPYLSALSLLVHATGADRFVAYAVHQGTIFALLAASLCALVLTSWRGPRSGVLLAAVIVTMMLGDATLQIASFPHPEIAIVAFCLAGCALWLNDRRGWGTVLFALAVSVREDGGLYAAAFLMALALQRPVSRETMRSPELMLAAATIVLSLLMFWIKSRFFDGFSAFAFNYSGNHWDHLTAENVALRLREFAVNPQALASIMPALILAVVSWRYLIFPVLMSPLIVAQLLAARIHLWEFHFYYAMPFLVIWCGLVVVAAFRSRQAAMRLVEPIVLLVAAIGGSAPFLYPLWSINSFPIAVVPFVWPTQDVAALSRKAVEMTDGVPGMCISTAVAAIAPDSFTPEQVLDPDVTVHRCEHVLLYYGDPHYRQLSWELRYWIKGPKIMGHLTRYDRPAWMVPATIAK